MRFDLVAPITFLPILVAMVLMGLIAVCPL
jgi:hypothetical protein